MRASSGKWRGHLHLKTSAAAVLVPGAAVGETFASELRTLGLEARFFSGRDLDLKADVVRVLTLHSAKGLEFPIVIIAGLDTGTLASARGLRRT